MTAIIPFMFENHRVRVLDKDGEPWFALIDVCSVLEIANSRDAATRLDEDEKTTIAITDGHINQGLSNNSPGTSLTVISESGVWAILLTSRKPEAKKFRKWLTSEVIPSIRKTGSYSARALTPAEQNLANAQLAVEFERRTAAIEVRQEIISSQTTAVAA